MDSQIYYKNKYIGLFKKHYKLLRTSVQYAVVTNVNKMMSIIHTGMVKYRADYIQHLPRKENEYIAL